MKTAAHQHCSCLENKELQQQADRSRQIIGAIFDSTQSFILLISLDHRIMFFNKKALHASKLLYGRDLNVGDSFMSFQRHGDEEMFQTFRDNFTRAVSTGSIVSSEREMTFHGVVSWYRFEYTPVYENENIIGVALRIVDISERKKKEQQIKMQHDQLLQIAWIQSHQTRQPIATILGLIHILDKTSLTEDNRKIITMMHAEIDKLDVVIRDTVIRANSAA